jgi:hypothetical protein
MAKASRAVEAQLRPLEGGERAATPALVTGLLRAVTRLRGVAAEQAEGVEDDTEIDELLRLLDEEMARTGGHWSDAFRQGGPRSASAPPISAPRTEVTVDPVVELPAPPPPSRAFTPMLAGLIETLENLRQLVAGLTQLEAEVGRRLHDLSHLQELDEVADALQRVRGGPATPPRAQPQPQPEGPARASTSTSQTTTYLIVSAAGQRAAIPLTAAVTVLPADAVRDGEVRVGDAQVPLLDLALVLGGPLTREGPVVVVEHAGQRRAFRVGEVHGWGELQPGDILLDPAQLLG